MKFVKLSFVATLIMLFFLIWYTNDYDGRHTYDGLLTIVSFIVAIPFLRHVITKWIPLFIFGLIPFAYRGFWRLIASAKRIAKEELNK